MKSSANSIKLLLSLNTIFGTVHVLIKGDIFDRANYNSHSAIITQKKARCHAYENNGGCLVSNHIYLPKIQFSVKEPCALTFI